MVLLANAAQGQTYVSMKVSLSLPGAQFIVDGQLFDRPQTFTWVEGTTHIIQFPHSTDPDGTEAQYVNFGTRYRLTGWTPTFLPSYSQNFTRDIETIVANSKFPELVGNVVLEFRLRLFFPQTTTPGYCDEHIVTPDQPDGSVDLGGVIYFDDACINTNQLYWMSASNHRIRAFNFPGYAFKGILVDGMLQPKPMDFEFQVNDATDITFVFDRAKRMRFSTFPADLEILIDGNPLVPQFYYTYMLPTSNSAGTCASFHRLPVGAPAGFQPLCVGDFEYVPGSIHRLDAVRIQRDRFSAYWVFDRFSNGMNPGPFVVPSDVDNITDIQAIFVRGVPANILSNVDGLKVFVDGSNTWSGFMFSAIWGEGQKHVISAPETIRDSRGRLYRFVSWSDGGAREHEVRVAAGSEGLAITANWELLGQIQVTSTPPGLPMTVDGQTCTTPCVVDKSAGQGLTFRADQNIAFGQESRYVFSSWTGTPNQNLSQQATFNRDVQTFNAVYRGSHSIMATTDPADGATFQYDPPAVNGFYPEGTVVQITLVENPGFKFVRWTGDLTTRRLTESITIRGTVRLIAMMERIPKVLPAGVRNAAASLPVNNVAPGSIISIYGEGMADDLKIGPSNPLSQVVGSTSVLVDDIYILPLMFVSPKQINAQLSSGLSDGEHKLTVKTSGKPDLGAKFTVKRNAPGVFFNVTESGMPLISALHEDGTAITEASPAKRGETITFYGTGFGSYDNPALDGFPLARTIVYKLIDPVKVLAGIPAPPGADQPQDAASADTADPALAAATPPVSRDPVSALGLGGSVGLQAIKLKLDTDLPTGNVLEISVTSNGVASNKVQLPIR